jgi:hypothetical protein
LTSVPAFPGEERRELRDDIIERVFDLRADANTGRMTPFVTTKASQTNA